MSEAAEDEFLSVEAAARLIASLHFVSIATASKSGEPWCSPVFFTCDEQLNLFWLSSPSSRHSLNIQENPRASLTVYDSSKKDGDGWGVYFECTAKRLTSEVDVRRMIALSRAKLGHFEFNKYDLLTGAEALRSYYMASPDRIWVNGCVKRGRLTIDERRELSMPELRRQLALVHLELLHK